MRHQQCPQQTASAHSSLQIQLTDPCEAYNVYPDFLPSAVRAGLPNVWPRGFPHDLITKPCDYSLVPSKAASIAVVQSLADNDPDVDGIFRLTRGVPFNFDRGVRHTIAVPQGTMTPWNAQVSWLEQPTGSAVGDCGSLHKPGFHVAITHKCTSWRVAVTPSLQSGFGNCERT
jgi:hypothetical protein